MIIAADDNDGRANHKAVTNILYADGHTDWLNAVQAKSVIAQVEAGVNPPK